jgi:hypothetical protein
MYKEMGLALYRDLYRSLTIRISKDRLNLKNIAAYTSTFPTV